MLNGFGAVRNYGLNIQFHGIQVFLDRSIVKVLSQNPDRGTNDDQGCHMNTLNDNAAWKCRLILPYRETYRVERLITVMPDMVGKMRQTLSHIIENTLLAESFGTLEATSTGSDALVPAMGGS
ncbi:hypothetical protein CEP54_014053 [Fusarium duplospermum]|uniref:Uncharacterized protein n=1 Tax=Fusarium duplospermum TaxID=1325734 RepID=A0A428NZ28_9HYPO|nr:hypothetical protein CEP54_014053 [Fusarium duplospermum]